MNPLNSVVGTIVSGFVLAVIVSLLLSSTGSIVSGIPAIIVWLHVIAGVVWIGLLYYFNFVQIPAVGEAVADGGGPGPAAINQYVAPRALAWFRYGALVTWLTGAAALEILAGGGGIVEAFTLQTNMEIIGVGAWLGTIMLLNVWGLIWPNQKKILGLGGVSASDEEKAKAKKIALIASRTNTLLSVPMLMCMIGGLQGHGLPF